PFRPPSETCARNNFPPLPAVLTILKEGSPHPPLCAREAMGRRNADPRPPAEIRCPCFHSRAGSDSRSRRKPGNTTPAYPLEPRRAIHPSKGREWADSFSPPPSLRPAASLFLF